MRQAHRFLGAGHRARDGFRIAQLDRYDGGEAPPVDRLERRDRQQDVGVERLPQHPALCLHDSLDPDLAPPHPDLLPDGALGVSEQLVRDVPSQHPDLPPLAHVGIGEGLASGDPVVLDQLVGRRHAEDHDAAQPLAPPDNIGCGSGVARLERHCVGIREGGLERSGIAAGDAGPARYCADGFLVQKAGCYRITPNLEGIGADYGAGEVLADIRVHALDDGHDGHQKSDADDYSKESEEGSKLAAGDGVERQAEGLKVRHATSYQ